MEETQGRTNVREGKKLLGFAVMDPEKQRQIARKGGVAAHLQGTAHEFTPEQAKNAGQIGGRRVREKYGSDHFSEIGRRGGLSVSRDREHMSRIGQKGGSV